jgi:hypothetical protein
LVMSRREWNENMKMGEWVGVGITPSMEMCGKYKKGFECHLMSLGNCLIQHLPSQVDYPSYSYRFFEGSNYNDPAERNCFIRCVYTLQFTSIPISVILLVVY